MLVKRSCVSVRDGDAGFFLVRIHSVFLLQGDEQLSRSSVNSSVSISDRSERWRGWRVSADGESSGRQDQRRPGQPMAQSLDLWS